MSNAYIIWGEHPGDDEGYYIGVADNEEGAVILAVDGIAARVDGEWDEYRPSDIKKLRELVESGKYAEALEHWNDNMSGFKITIDEMYLSSPTDVQANFNWPEEEEV